MPIHPGSGDGPTNHGEMPRVSRSFIGRTAAVTIQTITSIQQRHCHRLGNIAVSTVTTLSTTHSAYNVNFSSHSQLNNGNYYTCHIAYTCNIVCLRKAVMLSGRMRVLGYSVLESRRNASIIERAVSAT